MQSVYLLDSLFTGNRINSLCYDVIVLFSSHLSITPDEFYVRRKTLLKFVYYV